MEKTRIVQKGNVNASGFDVRIIESDSKSYYYHFIQFEDGESAIEAIQPFNLRAEVNITWNDLPLKVKEAHYKNLYPNDTLNDYAKKCFFYGKQQADEEIAAEQERKNQREKFLNKVVYKDGLCGYYMAEIIYDNIGKWNSFQVIYERNGKGKFCVDDNIITIEHWRVVSIEDKADYDKERKNWGKRVGEIAKAAGTSFDMATVVGNITDTDRAIEMLKEIVEKLNSDKFQSHMKRMWYRDYNTNERTLKEAIREFLFDNLSSSHNPTKLNISSKFCKEAKKILNNQ